MSRLLLATILGLLLYVTASGQTDVEMSVNDFMVNVVAPTTDTIWGIEDPQTDEEWQVYIDAANKIIAAGATLRNGGTGPNDRAWAADPEWQAFVDQLVAAGNVAKAAAESKDLEGMWTAGEVIYPPCEECHIKFHPGVQGVQ